MQMSAYVRTVVPFRFIKKFPGNPTRSYRTQHPLRVVGEVQDWQGHSPDELQKMWDHLDELKRLGIEAIND